MNLLNDLIQALLIPLVTWEVRLLGVEVALPVTPLLLFAVGLFVDQGLRRIRRRRNRTPALGASAPDGWEEPGRLAADA